MIFSSLLLHSQCGLYSINVVWDPNERNLAKINTNNGDIEIMSNDFIFEWYITDGGADIDPVNKIYYIKGTEYDISIDTTILTYRLYGIDLNTGKVISNPHIQQNDAVHQMRYNCLDNTLYAIEVIWDPNERYLLKIDPATGIHTRISSISAFDWYVTSASTAINPFSNTFFVITTDNDFSEYYLTSLNLNTGMPVKQIKLAKTYTLLQMDYNCSDNTLYALQTIPETNEAYLVKIDQETGEIIRISPYSIGDENLGFNGGPINSGTNMMYVMGFDNLKMSYVMCSIDLTSGLIVNNIEITPDKFHQMRSSCSCKPIARFDVVENCSQDTVKFISEINSGSVSWNFGDPNCAVSENISSEYEPMHVYSQKGTYNVTYTVKGCGVADSVTKTISVQDPLKVNLGRDTSICSGDSVLLDLNLNSNDFSFIWNDGSIESKRNIETGGVYSVTVSSSNCKAIDSITIDVDKFDFNFPSDTTICKDKITIYAGDCEDCNYKWSTGGTSNSIIITEQGNYTLTVSNDNCDYEKSIFVAFDSTSSIFSFNDTVLCQGQNLKLDAGNFESYLWQDNSVEQYFEVNQDGLYSVRVEKANCFFSDTVSVVLDIIPDLYNSIYTSCNSNIVIVEPNMPFDAEYLWEDNDNSKSRIFNGAIDTWVSVSDSYCKNTEYIQIENYEVPDFSLGKDTLLCFGEQLELKIDVENVEYFWQGKPSGPNILVDHPGIYYAKAFKGNCQSDDTININYSSPININIKSEHELCFGDSILLEVESNAKKILFDGNPIGEKNYIYEPGSYKIQAQEGNCNLDTIINISGFSFGIDFFPNDTIICLDTFLLLTLPDTSVYKIISDDSTNSIIIYDAGEYNIPISDGKCVEKESIIVNKVDCSCALWAPNALLDNHPSKELCSFIVKGLNLKKLELSIFDKWGNLIWYSNEIIKGGDITTTSWNSSKDLGIIQSGSYFYKIDAECRDDAHIMKTNIEINKIHNLYLIK